MEIEEENARQGKKRRHESDNSQGNNFCNLKM
jgi:hypothetical protein